MKVTLDVVPYCKGLLTSEDAQTRFQEGDCLKTDPMDPQSEKLSGQFLELYLRLLKVIGCKVTVLGKFQNI